MRKIIAYKILLLVLLLCVFAGCKTKEDNSKQELILCSSMGQKITELLAESYSQHTGVKVQIHYLPAGTQNERFEYLRQHKFDIWLGGTSEEYFLADEQNLLQPYLTQESYKVPVELRNLNGQWTSLYLGYIGFLSNKNNLHAYGLYAPEKWEDLLHPLLQNEIVMADFSLGGVSYGMLTSIWQLKGKEEALNYATQLNAQDPYYTSGFGEAVDLVYIGKKTVAIVPLEYALLMETRHRHLFATVVKDANRNILTGGAIMKNAMHIQNAQNFLDYLMSDEGMQVLPSHGYNYIWHVKNYPYNVGRREFIGNVKVPVDDLGWTSIYKNEIINKWLQAK